MIVLGLRYLCPASENIDKWWRVKSQGQVSLLELKINIVRDENERWQVKPYDEPAAEVNEIERRRVKPQDEPAC